MSKNSFITILKVIGLAFILSLFGMRFCPFFNIFDIPCPGCGLTRSFIYLFKGDIITSLKYNILGVLFVISGIVFLIFFILGKTYILKSFIEKNNNLIFILCFILMIIVFIININNPLLY